LDYDLNLKNVLSKSRDVLSHIVAKHVVCNEYDAILLTADEVGNVFDNLFEVSECNRVFYGKRDP
jgi:hypothetical protein